MEVLLKEGNNREKSFKRVMNSADFDGLMHEVCLEWGYESLGCSGVFHDGNSVRHLYVLKKLVKPLDAEKNLARQKRASELVRTDRFQAEKIKRESPHTIGRCWHCNRAYIWKQSPKRPLSEERCPVDFASLSQTMLTYKGAWFKI